MNKRLIYTCILIIYTAILIKVMVFKDVPLIRIGSLMINFGGTDASRPANFIPLKTILPYLFGENGLMIASINLIGNIIFLVPIGFLIPLIFPKLTWKIIFTLAVGVGLAIETLQVLLGVGIFDIDDVILNGFGMMIGYWAYAFLTRWMSSKEYIKIIIAASITIITALATFYVIFLKDQSSNPRVRSGTLSDNLIKNKAEVSESGNPCGRTNGTGEIVNKGVDTITVKLNDGINQIIKIGDLTEIKNSNGFASQGDLKIGDRVTIVIYDDITASSILVCSK